MIKPKMADASEGGYAYADFSAFADLQPRGFFLIGSALVQSGHCPKW
jgi:hypothetical protein